MGILRGSGVDTGSPSVLSQSDRKAFANHLDKLLSIHMRTPRGTENPSTKRTELLNSVDVYQIKQQLAVLETRAASTS